MAPRIFLEGLSAAFFCGRVAGGGGSLIRVPSVVECRLVLAPWSALRTQAPARAEREGSVALAPWSALRTQAPARAERDCRRTIVGWERGFGAVVRPADTGAGASGARLPTDDRRMGAWLWRRGPPCGHRRRRDGGEAEARGRRGGGAALAPWSALRTQAPARRRRGGGEGEARRKREANGKQTTSASQPRGAAPPPTSCEAKAWPREQGQAQRATQPVSPRHGRGSERRSGVLARPADGRPSVAASSQSA